MSIHAIATALAALAPADVITGVRAILPSDVHSLHPVEKEAVRRAVAKRRNEFATGRALLRELIGRNVPIAVGDGRRPDVPRDVVASLAHTSTIAVAAVAPAGSVAALGVDVEPATPLDAAMAAAILRPDEVDAHADLDPHLAFTLKEAVYKAWSSLGGRMLDHHDVRLDVRSEGERWGTFTAVIDDAFTTDGRWSRVADHWLAFVVTPAEMSPAGLSRQGNLTTRASPTDGGSAPRSEAEHRLVEANEDVDGDVVVAARHAADVQAVEAAFRAEPEGADLRVHVHADVDADALSALDERMPTARFVVVVRHPYTDTDAGRDGAQLDEEWVRTTGDVVDLAERIGPARCLVVRGEDLDAGRTDALRAFVAGASSTPEREVVRVRPPAHRPSRAARALAVDLGYDLDAAPAPATSSARRAPSTDMILPAERGDAVPASSAQQRLLFMDALEPGLAVHHLPSIRRLSGPIDVGAIEAALGAVVARHEPLRTDFELRDGEWFQVVRPPGTFELPYDDLREVPEGERDAAIAEAIYAEVRRPFDLLHGLKARARLLRSADDEHILVVTLHHIAADGTSIVQMTTETSAFYAAAVLGVEPAIAPLPVQYADFTLWQRAFATSPQYAAEVEYWKTTLSGTLPQLDLPTDRPRPAVFAHEARSVPIAFDAELTARWRAAARAAGVTPFMYLLASYAAVLARWTEADDLVIGIANANRRAETENLVGLFASTLPIRVAVDVEAPFTRLLEEVKRQTLGALANQDVPFDEIVRVVNPPRDRSRAPLFQTLFVLNNMRAPELSDVGARSAETTVEKLQTTSAAVELDLSVTVEEGADGLFGRIDFPAALFDESTVRRLVDHWCHLLDAATRDGGRPIAALEVLSPDEHRAVAVDFASSASEPDDDLGLTRLDDVVALRVLASPDETAFVHRDEQMSYAEWDRRANALARRLLRAGVGPGDRVGVALGRSLSMPIAVLAILKCGAAYVPLDADLPAERLAYMIDNAAVGVALVSGGSLDHVGAAASALVTIDVGGDDDGADLADAPVRIQTEGDLGGGASWVIYTSGSTGRPKGVEVEHASALNFVRGMLDAPGMAADDVVLAVPALSFDPSVLDLFVPSLVGARVVIAEREDVMDARRLAALIESSGATMMQATPTTWSMLLQSGWVGSPRLTALCGGEAMSTDLARRLRSACRAVWNLYGPTETTVWATAHEVTDASLVSTTVPVGRPIPNVVVRIVDPKDRLVPIGVAGEILIGGAGLARGYVGRPDLTAQSFVPDPLDPATTVYRTGDLGRWLPNGELELLGRRDFQIKLHGNRIELGEIEAALRDIDAVAEAVVVPLVERGNTRLIAYLLGSSAGVTATAADVRSVLLQRLPRPMIPSAFVWLDAFPLTPSGKVDRRALPAPTGSGTQRVHGDGRPRNPLEARLARMFAMVLDRDEVGINDDFFELGGYSLIATRLFAMIEEDIGRHVPMATLFEASTVATLAEHLRRETSDDAEGCGDDQARGVTHVVPIRREGEHTPFFCVHGSGGNVLNFRDLSVALGPAYPFYGLQARGIDGAEQPHGSIEAMAIDYIREIRGVQPEGPYIVGGYSGGGLVAFEMARRLIADGEEVPLVVLLDTYPPVIPAPANRFRDRVERLRAEGFSYIGHIIRRQLGSRRHAAATRRLDDIVARGERVPVELRERFIDRSFFGAAEKYVTEKYDGRVLLIRGDFVPFVFRSVGPNYQWDTVVDPIENLSVVVLPGAHDTLVLNPYATRVAQVLGQAIDEVDSAAAPLGPM